MNTGFKGFHNEATRQCFELLNNDLRSMVKRYVKLNKQPTLDNFYSMHASLLNNYELDRILNMKVVCKQIDDWLESLVPIPV